MDDKKVEVNEDTYARHILVLMIIHYLGKAAAVGVCVYFMFRLLEQDNEGWGWLFIIAVYLSASDPPYQLKVKVETKDALKGNP